MKKFFSLVLALVMALSLTTVAWGAWTGTGTGTEADPYQVFTEAELTDAVAEGGYIKLMDTLTTSATFTIADGKTVYLDMNGKTITANDTKVDQNANTGNYELFYIYGVMNVTGNGTITVSSTTNRYWNAMCTIFHNRGGVLTIENGTFTNNGGTDMAFVVDNSGNYYGDATTNIKGGSLSSTYTAIRNRMEQNSHGASGTAYLNVTGGTISGTTSAIWAQAASTSTSSPATGAINISGGNVGLVNTARSAGAECMTTISGNAVVEGVKAEAGELNVTGGTITGTLTILNADGSAADKAAVLATYNVTDGTTLVSDGTGGYVVVEESANTWGSLYGKKTSAGSTIGAVTLEYYKAVAPIYNDDGIVTNQPSIAYYLCPELTGTTYLVEVTSLGAADVVVYNDVDGKAVFKYLDIVDNVEYMGNGVLFANFGKACGQYKDANYDKTAQYYTFQFGVFKAVETSPLALMVNGKVVPVEPATGAFVQHIASYTYNDQFEVTAVKCGVCGTPAVIVPNYASLPDAVKAVSGNNVINGTMYFYWPVAATGTVTDKVQSAETFDAGIAMYVGMSVMAAAGSAVVLKKRED